MQPQREAQDKGQGEGEGEAGAQRSTSYKHCRPSAFHSPQRANVSGCLHPLAKGTAASRQGLQDIAHMISFLNKQIGKLEGIPDEVKDLKRHISMLVECSEKDQISAESVEITMLTGDVSQDGPDWENI
jgi:hypothetical protein